jgi:hypothetical protein
MRDPSKWIWSVIWFARSIAHSETDPRFRHGRGGFEAVQKRRSHGANIRPTWAATCDIVSMGCDRPCRVRLVERPRQKKKCVLILLDRARTDLNFEPEAFGPSHVDIARSFLPGARRRRANLSSTAQCCIDHVHCTCTVEFSSIRDFISPEA